MIIVTIFLVGLILCYYNYTYKFLLSNFLFYITIYVLLQCGGNIDWYFIGYNLGLNLYSYYLVILFFFMMGVILKVINSGEYFCIILNLFLTLVLFFTFVSVSFLMFYFFF